MIGTAAGAMPAECLCGLEKVMKKYNIKTILEFGSGRSSYWFAKRAKELYTVDTDSLFFPKKLKNVICIHIDKDGTNLDLIGKKKYDLVLIDCLRSLRAKVFNYIVKNIKWKILCIHDWDRDHKLYDEKYLSRFKRYDYGSLMIIVKRRVV